MPGSPEVNLWSSPEHALDYLRRADSIPHRTEGEAALLEFLPAEPRRILDLGSGGGRLLALVKAARPRAQFIALDFSPAMLETLQKLFAGDAGVTIAAHDFENRLPPLGVFDAVVSSFAIHHVSHERKRALYEEIFEIVAPGGVFCNLEHVTSPTPELHDQFLSSGRSESRESRKMRRTNCSLWRRSWRGCGRLVSWMSTAIGSGANSRSSAARNRFNLGDLLVRGAQ